MAYEVPGFSFTLPAGEAFTDQFRFGVLDGAVVDVCADGEWAIGVVQNTPAIGQAATIMCSGISIVEAGAAVVAGVAVGSDATGRVITAATADVTLGRALEAASAAGEFIAVLLGGTPTAAA